MRCRRRLCRLVAGIAAGELISMTLRQEEKEEEEEEEGDAFFTISKLDNSLENNIKDWFK